MIALIPLARFRVQYEVASGRPYSTLEQLALRAIAQGATTVEHLYDVFHVHDRLLVEAVVTLTKAGWVAVGGPGGAGFVLTASGQQAVSGEEIPPLLAVTPKKTFVLVELVTGMLIPNNDIRFVSRRDLGELWDGSVRLPAEVPETDLDEGQVQGFLPKQRGEWIRWIGPIDLVSRGLHWLPVDVNVSTGQVSGLPDSLHSRLQSYVLDACERMRSRVDAGHLAATLRVTRPAQAAPSDRERARGPEATFETAIQSEDLLLTDAEHEQYASRVLEHATSTVLIASAFVSGRRLDSLVPRIDAALDRGINVDLLWGYAATEDGGTAPLARLKKLAYDAQRRGASGKLRFNSLPSSSHAKLLIWDGPDGYEACVGSCNWLSVQPRADLPLAASNASIRLRHPLIVARLARCAAVLWHAAQSEALASTGDRWRRVATDLEQRVAVGGADETPRETNCRVRLLLDRDHEAALRDSLAHARGRLLIVSHRLGPAAEVRLVTRDGPRETGFVGQILYGTTELDSNGLGRVQGRAKSLGAELAPVEGLHAKVVVSDSTLIVSSYNFLSADPFGKATRSRELGILIEGGQAADVVAIHYGLASASTLAIEG